MMSEEKMAKIRELGDMKCKLQGWANAEFEKGKESIDTKEMGEVVDMIKDLAEAEKFCMESMYYESVVTAMDEATADYRMGYGGPNKMNARYPDFMPYVNQEPYVEEYINPELMRYGYDGGRDGNSGNSSSNSGGRSNSSSGMRGGRSMSSGYRDGKERWTSSESNMMNAGDYPGRYGGAYNRYREMRRHYTETGNPADKEEMSMSAQEHVMDTISSMRDIWKDAAPELRTKMKSDLQRLMSEMS